MPQQQNTKVLYLNRVFLYAMKLMVPKFSEASMKIDFISPNRIKVHNWSQDNLVCKKFKSNFDKILQSLNVIKLNQPDRKVERIKLMKKWKKQFHILGLGIILVKKNYGNVYYLMGCTSQLQLYDVLLNLQMHSYKKFTTSFVKFLYKPVFQALIESKDYQILIFEKLKITSTQMRIVTLENHNKKKANYVELFFQLEEYMKTDFLVAKFKQLLTEEFFVCGLIFEIDRIEFMKQSLQKSPLLAWTVFEKKRQNIACAYLICKNTEAHVKIPQIIQECLYINFMTFLKGLGNTNENLKELINTTDPQRLSEDKKFLVSNFVLKGNVEKNPNQISISLKEDKQKSLWIQGVKKLL